MTRAVGEDDLEFCSCGGNLYPKSDEQYGTIWECEDCHSTFVSEDT